MNMIDNNLKIEKKEAQEFKPLPENIYQVELLDVTSKETATYDTRSKPEEEQIKETILSFQFTLLGGTENGESLRGRNVWANFVPTYLYIGKNGKNNLYRIVEALKGSDLTLEEEANGIDGAYLNNLIGKQCRIGTEHKKSGDKIFDNISTYYPAEDEKKPLDTEEKDKARVKTKEEKEETKEDEIDTEAEADKAWED